MYSYVEQKPRLFDDAGQRMFLSIRDRVHRLLKQSGAITMGSAITGGTGDTWMLLACVDRMVELEEIREVQQVKAVAGQDRIFISSGSKDR